MTKYTLKDKRGNPLFLNLTKADIDKGIIATKCKKLMINSGVSMETQHLVRTEMFSGDYKYFLHTVNKYFLLNTELSAQI